MAEFVLVCFFFLHSKLNESSWHCFKLFPVFLEPGRAYAEVTCDVDTQLSCSQSSCFPHAAWWTKHLVWWSSKDQGMEPPPPCRWSQQTSIQKMQLQPLCCLLLCSVSLARANAAVDGGVTLELFPGLKTLQVTALGSSFFARNQDWNQQGEKVPCAVVWDSVQLREPVPAVRQEQSSLFH